MGRHASFDRDVVVRAARQVFWEQGFATTSLPDLEAATGLQRSSLYHAFGSKQGLFEACVTSYLNELIRPALAPLHPSDGAESHVSSAALDEYLCSLIKLMDSARRGAVPPGCLLISSATAPIGSEPTVARAITAYRQELDAAVEHGVDALHTGKNEPQRRILSDAITALIVAAFTTARSNLNAAIETLETARQLLSL